MKIIEKIADMIDDEIGDAKKYIDCALKYKTERPKLAETFAKISEEEMKHMALLHNEVVDIIEAYKREKGNPPESMLAIYEYLHNKHIEKAAEVKTMQGMFRSV